MMSAGFDQIFNLYNSATMDKLDIIDTYVYRTMRQGGNYGLSTAIGLYQSIMGLILVLFTNWLARRYDPEVAIF